MGLLTRFFAAAAAPYTINDLALLAGWGSGRESASGVDVNHRTAMGYGPWYRGVTLLAADTAKIPLTVYRRKGAGKAPDVGHPAYRLLRSDPSETDTAFHFVETLTGHAISRGNGYAYVERGDGVTPSGLTILTPEWVTPVRKDGVVWYVYQVPDQRPRRLPAHDVLHIRGFGEDGLCGLSVLAYAAESLGLAVGQRKYSAVFFRNSGRPAVVLEAPVKMKDEAKMTLLQGWDRLYSGLDNQHRTAVLDAGLKANVLSFNAEESQLIESRQLSIREVALFLGLPAHKISDIARTSFSSLEQENADYLNSSLDPWLCRWEGECRKKLLTEEEKAGDTHLVQFERDAILRADMTSRTAYAKASLGGHPWQSVNEVREGFGLNPDPNPASDEIAAPLNMSNPGGDPDASDAPPPKPPAAPPGDATATPPDPAARAALRAALVSASARIARRVGAAARKAAGSTAGYMAWLADPWSETAAIAADNLGPLETLAQHLGGAAAPASGAGMLALLRAGYAALADTATPSTLAAAVESAAARLESEAPGRHADTTLGSES